MSQEEKQEIEEDLSHQQRIYNWITKRLFALEEIRAQRGEINTDPSISFEIETLTEQRSAKKQEIELLQIRRVERHLSFEEAEYRAILARAWDTERGEPKYADKAQLEYERLRLRLPFERTEKLEADVRKGLALQTCKHIEAGLLENMSLLMQRGDFGEEHITHRVLGLLGRAIRLDVDSAIVLMRDVMISTPKPVFATIESFEQKLHSASRYALRSGDPDYKDSLFFGHFMDMVRRTATDCGWKESDSSLVAFV